MADVELCITLGGDGTVLHVATIFGNKAALPPFICFALGTLGAHFPLRRPSNLWQKQQILKQAFLQVPRMACRHD